jgi:hydrogenase large subunit
VHDHLVHFYHLHALDWVDVVSGAEGRPEEDLGTGAEHFVWPLSSPGYFRDLQNRLKKFVESGQLGPFANAYWGNPAYKLPPEANLMAVAHYLEALDFQKEIVKVHTIFGGKNPHPNWLVGGVPCAINVHDTGCGGRDQHGAPEPGQEHHRPHQGVRRAGLHPRPAGHRLVLQGLAARRRPVVARALLSYGDIPEQGQRLQPGNLLLPRGAIINGNLDKIHEVDLKDPEQIQEFVTHSWYKYADESKGLHPFDGVTEPHYKPEGPNFKGTRTKIENLDEVAKYSWIKAPRWRGHAMEVGCLSRMVLGYLQPKQFPFIKETIDGVLKKLDVPVTALFSTLGRTAARGIETLYCADLQVRSSTS